MIDFEGAYKILPEDKVFIDTNILIFLFSPSFVNSREYQVEKYSSIYNKLLANQSELYVNELVISEFINRCMRIDFERNFNISDKKDYKKDYRPSEEYDTTLKIVLKQVKKILKSVNQINDDFTNFDIVKSVDTYLKSDFNDLIIAETVTKNNLKLLSDDGDFKRDLGINTDWYLAS